MTKTTAEGTAAAGIEQGRFSVPGWLVIVVALAILVAYAVFSYSMLDYSKGNADHWDRALLIFRSVEALAFAAAGAVLGVQI